jgi:hypothetical protein
MKKPISVVASQFAREIEDRIDRDYDPRRNPNTVPFSREQLLAAADGADAIFVTPLDRLDSIFFQKVSPKVRVIATYSVDLSTLTCKGRRSGRLRWPIHQASTATQRRTLPCCFSWALPVARTRPNNSSEQELGDL